MKKTGSVKPKEDNIKIYMQRIRCKDMTFIHLAADRK